MDERAREAGSAKEFLLCAGLLPAIREKYASSFDLLEIPEILRIDECSGQHGTIFFREYKGEKYNDRWTEQTGGSLLGKELSSEMARLVGDFRKIDIDWVLGHPIGRRIGETAFNLENWLRSLSDRKLIANGVGISDAELSCAEQLVGTGFESRERILSNGDFYPRNLIKLATKFVVVDWGIWAGNRACFIDYLPNVIAFAYIHMWNNKQWRQEFLNHASALAICPEDLQKGVVIKAFEQALYWKDHLTLYPPQVQLFREALQSRG